MALHELARRIAAHRAMEAVLFEHAGAWIAETPEPALKPQLAAWSSHHGAHLDMWADRFPAVPGLDLDDATREARTALHAIEQELTAAADTTARLTVALDLLGRLEGECASDRARIDPLVDAPTARILDVVLADVRSDVATVRAHA